MSVKEKVYKRIDRDYDAHMNQISDFLRHPSISQTGEGMDEIVEYLKDWLVRLGCVKVEAVKPDYYWPIVYGEYNAGAEKTLIVYGMYDVQPVDDGWTIPPFEARIEERDPFGRVYHCRGCMNTKGPMATTFNAVEAIQAVDELPVNHIFVLEGEEEMGSRSMPGFVERHQRRLRRADAVWFPICSQDQNGMARPLLGSEGLLYIELETSGARWGRGPKEFGIHGGYKRFVDSPAWRHIKAIGTLVEDDGNRVAVEGWYDGIAVPSEEDKRIIEEGYRNSVPALDVFDPELYKRFYKFDHYLDDMTDPKDIFYALNFGTSFNLDGIWGGYTGPGTKTFLPHKVTSKHNIRFVPNQRSEDLQRKIRSHLDKHGYSDVEMRFLGGYSWGVGKYRSPAAEAMYDMYEEFSVPYSISPPIGAFQLTSPAWPAYVFLDPPLRLPIVGGGLGHGALAHTPQEYYVVDGYDGKHCRVHGVREVEKSNVSFLYHFAER
jgi:acetylornithine deacetylase/succinyl-diaminopimelate desuccinylase-like protein